MIRTSCPSVALAPGGDPSRFSRSTRAMMVNEGWFRLAVTWVWGSRSCVALGHHVPVAISDRDRKILWGRSGNRCVVCRRVLVAERTPTDREALIGEEAHIAARSPGGACYGECALDIVDRYENLILLCRVDHKRVDDQWRHYTTSRLQQIKAEHEAWVEHSLGDVPASTHPWTSAGDQVVTGSIPWAPPHFVPPL